MIEEQLKQLELAEHELEYMLDEREKKKQSLLHKLKALFPVSRKRVFNIEGQLMKLTLGLIGANKEFLRLIDFIQSQSKGEDEEDDDEVGGYA
jgi:hypothetical protein